ncbi:MAG TPA: serine hydrolase domain-containing protein [Rhizomicrobium sp.]|jgi:CubicO group peptidase (beta-lactamase class C family)
MSRIAIAVGAALLLFASCAVAQGARGYPLDVDAYLASQMEAQHIPGLSFAVVRDGVVVASGARGLANVELSAPAGDATEFEIASMTKPITASAVMLLAQQGALSIDDPVAKYLAVPDTWKRMTIRQLLSHTAGVKDHFRDFPAYPPLPLDRRLSYTKDEYLKAHIDAPLNFSPGSQWAYSGGGYVILGAIIEKVSGQRYADYMRDHVFGPLGMEHTHIASVSDVIPNRASGYTTEDGKLRNGAYTGEAHISGADIGVLTTAADMAKWLIAVSTPRMWTAASRDLMWTPAKLSDGRDAIAPTGLSYGLGWFVSMFGRFRLVGHDGSLFNAFSSSVFFLPEKQFGVVVLTNQSDANPRAIALGIAARCDPELKPPHELSPQPERNPAATARAKAFVAALFRGGELLPFATSGLVRHLSAIAHPLAPAGAPAPAVAFIADEDLALPIQRFGASAVRLAYYKITIEGDDHWITLYLTAAGRIADLAGY